MNDKEMEEVAKQETDILLSGMVEEFTKFISEGNENLSTRQRILIIGRVVNYSHHAYMGLINKMIREHEEALLSKLPEEDSNEESH